MTDPRHNIRDVFPPTGPEISAKSWLTEAPLRMLMNNLHPDVAENPHELVVYGGIGRAAPPHLGGFPTRSSPPCASSTRIRPFWCNRASRWAYSAPTRTRRAC